MYHYLCLCRCIQQFRNFSSEKVHTWKLVSMGRVLNSCTTLSRRSKTQHKQHTTLAIPLAKLSVVHYYNGDWEKSAEVARESLQQEKAPWEGMTYVLGASNYLETQTNSIVLVTVVHNIWDGNITKSGSAICTFRHTYCPGQVPTPNFDSLVVF